MKLPHAGTTRQIPYVQLFVEPRVLPNAKGTTPGDDEPQPLSVLEMLACSTRAVLLGDPGGGKSTLSLKLTYDTASGAAAGLSARVPFIVVLRDYAPATRTAAKEDRGRVSRGLLPFAIQY